MDRRNRQLVDGFCDPGVKLMTLKLQILVGRTVLKCADFFDRAHGVKGA